MTNRDLERARRIRNICSSTAPEARDEVLVEAIAAALKEEREKERARLQKEREAQKAAREKANAFVVDFDDLKRELGRAGFHDREIERAAEDANGAQLELDQITTDTVKQLGVKFTFSTGVTNGHEAAPLARSPPDPRGGVPGDGRCLAVLGHRPRLAKIAADTGWHAILPWEKTVQDLLDDWRARVSAETATAGRSRDASA